MNKLDMILDITRVIGSRTKAQMIVDRLFQQMCLALQNGDKVVVQGFGSFHIVIRKPKKGRIIKTGQEVIIPERKHIKFRKAKHLDLNNAKA